MPQGRVIALPQRLEYNDLFKIAIIGDDCSGKTKIIKSFKEKSFDNNYVPTTEVSTNLVGYEMHGKKLNCIWLNTLGQF